MNIEWTMFAIHLNTRLMAVSWPNHKSCVALTSSSFMITPGSLKSLSGRKNKVSMSWKRNVSMSMLEVRWLSEISKATGELRLFRRPRNPLERDRSGFRTASHSTTYLGLLATLQSSLFSPSDKRLRRETIERLRIFRITNSVVWVAYIRYILRENDVLRHATCVTCSSGTWVGSRVKTCLLFGLCEGTTTY